MIACFDTETTGVSRELDELLQITIIDENCNILLESYITPPKRTSWRNAEKVNHISPEQIFNNNYPTAKELAPKIKEIFDKAELIIGYNVNFDIGFVEKDCGFSIDKDKVVDSYTVFKKECTKLKINLPHKKLGNAIDFYCPEAKADYVKNAHDASCDAIATMRVYLSQIQKDKKRYYQQTKTLSSETANLFSQFLTGQPKNEKIDEKEQDEDSIER